MYDSPKGFLQWKNNEKKSEIQFSYNASTFSYVAHPHL